MNVYDIKYNDEGHALLSLKKMIELKNATIDDALDVAKGMARLNFKSDFGVEIVTDPQSRILGIFPIDETVIKGGAEGPEITKRALLVEGTKVILYYNFDRDFLSVEQTIQQAADVFGIEIVSVSRLIGE